MKIKNSMFLFLACTLCMMQLKSMETDFELVTDSSIKTLRELSKTIKKKLKYGTDEIGDIDLNVFEEYAEELFSTQEEKNDVLTQLTHVKTTDKETFDNLTDIFKKVVGAHIYKNHVLKVCDDEQLIIHQVNNSELLNKRLYYILKTCILDKKIQDLNQKIEENQNKADKNLPVIKKSYGKRILNLLSIGVILSGIVLLRIHTPNGITVLNDFGFSSCAINFDHVRTFANNTILYVADKIC